MRNLIFLAATALLVRMVPIACADDTIAPDELAAVKAAEAARINTIDSVYGAVVAIYGGKDYLAQQFDNAFSAKVQTGSGFKPYVLATALNSGYGLDTVVDGSSPQNFAGVAVKNNEGRSYGNVDLVTATQDSINTAYVNLGLSVGLGKVVAMAESMGVPAVRVEQPQDLAGVLKEAMSHKDGPLLVDVALEE